MHRSPRSATIAIVAVMAVMAAMAVAGCRGGRPAEPVPAPDGVAVRDAGAGQEVGGPGTICRLGRMSEDSTREVHACGPGLSCCYPCGVEGCDSVCMEDCGPPRP